MRSASYTLAILTTALVSAPATSAAVIVQPGDTLSSLAAALLSDDSRWVELCELNASVLPRGCDFLAPGTSLSVPGTVQNAEQPPQVEVPAATAQGEGVNENSVLPTAWEAIGLVFDATDGSNIKVEMGGASPRHAVWDPVGEIWIVPASDYDGGVKTELTFSTGTATTVRVYPLRANDNSQVIWARFDGLSTGSSYTASWALDVVDQQATVTDMVLTPSD